jgi:acyl-coenzyme A thioesterase 9
MSEGSILLQPVLIGQLHESHRHQFNCSLCAADRLDMLQQIDPSLDLRLSGQVIHTGSSSMEVAVRMENVGPGKDMTVLLGEFRGLDLRVTSR